MVLTMMVSVAELERAQINERTQSGQLKKANILTLFKVWVVITEPCFTLLYKD